MEDSRMGTVKIRKRESNTKVTEVCRWLEEGVLEFDQNEALVYLQFFVLPSFKKGLVTTNEVTQLVDTYARLNILNLKT